MRETRPHMSQLLTEFRLCTHTQNTINMVRMSRRALDLFIDLVGPKIVKQDTRMRMAITPEDKILTVLRILATGNSLRQLESYSYVSHSAMSKFFPEVLKAIINALEPYNRTPQTVDDWKRIAKAFEEKWGFPHCLGAWDGQHIHINCPKGSGSLFRCYKGKLKQKIQIKS